MKRINKFSWQSCRTFSVLGLFACLLLSPQAHAAQNSLIHARLAQTLHDHGDITAGDLDGDELSDLVLTARGPRTLPGNHHALEIRLSDSGDKQTFQFPHGGGLTITARDVDGDLDLDLVVTSRLTGAGVAVLINDGFGVFSEGELPGRKPWVWGHGQRLVSGTAAETSLAAAPAGNEDATTPQEQAAPSPHLAATCVLIHHAAVTPQARGAFYIRPPPSSL